MRYDAVIFDLDGTLLNSLEDLMLGTNYALSTLGFPARSLEETRHFVGNGVAKLIERAVPEGTSPEDEARCLKCFGSYYPEHMEDHTAPYAGVLPLLEHLRDAGCRTAVVSNKFDIAVKPLCAHYFGDLIPVAIGESPTVRKKPAPDAVFAALQELGVTPDRCVYVGDSDVDIDTARNAGMDCISVSWGFRDADFLTAHGASRIVDDPQALWDALGS